MGGVKDGRVTVKAIQTAVNVHDFILYVGDSWNPTDNFDSSLDKDGNVLDYASFIAAGGTVDDSKVDTNTSSTYDVTYILNGITTAAKITVKAKAPIKPDGPDKLAEPTTPTKPNNKNLENTTL